MSGPAKIIVERTGSSTPAVAIHFSGHVTMITEDTAMVLADALKQVAYSEAKRLTVYEETNHRPAGLYSERNA